MQLDINGRITGLKLAGSATETSVVFQVDRFSIVTPGVNPIVPFVVGQDQFGQGSRHVEVSLEETLPGDRRGRKILERTSDSGH